MDIMTLTYEQLLTFTGWTENYARKQSMEKKVAHLNKMGAQVLTTTDKGTKATFTIGIPSTFWRMFIVQSMTYNKLGADYINMILDGKDMVNTDEGIFIQFHTEMYPALINSYHVEENTVKSTCSRIRTFLNEYDLIKVGNEADDVKSHRVKKNGKWVTGTAAVLYDQQARNIWRNFFLEKNAEYALTHPDATEAPLQTIVEEIRQLYGFDMKDRLDVDVYRVAKRTLPTQNLITDINEMRLLFLQTGNLTLVKEELTRRQANYKAQKERKQEKAKAAQAKAVKENHIPKEELKKMKADMKQAKAMKEYVQPTADQARRAELRMLEIEKDLVPNQLGGDE